VRVSFLGTNGWYATGTGNTICTAIIAKGRLVVLDAGDGFQHVPELAKKNQVKKIDVFLSHLHLDHCAGLHILPKFEKGLEVRVFAPWEYIKDLEYLLDHPFTANALQLQCKVSILPLREGKNELPYAVIALPLIHADPCMGFRIELEKRAVAYCTDTGPCENIVELGREADLLITECALPPGSRSQRSWPHLSPEMAARLAKKANAKMLALTHFDANNYSEFGLRKKAELFAKKIFEKTVAARDRQIVQI
jgi:ribonuclease BN (tRNA processing enzyme)